jgi:hypothetical protein
MIAFTDNYQTHTHTKINNNVMKKKKKIPLYLYQGWELQIEKTAEICRGPGAA